MAQNIGQKALQLLRSAGRSIATPFRRGVGIGQELVLGGLSDEERRRRQQQTGALGNISRKTQLTQREQQQFQEKPGKFAGKSYAGQTAFFVPGGQSTRLGKILAAGGAGGLAGYGASEEGKEVGGTLGGAATGAATMGIVTSKPVKKLATKIGELTKNFGRQAAAKVSKATPSAFQKASEKGIDINEAINKYMPAGAGVDDMVGDVSQRGKGGIINNLIQQSESQINNVLRQSGDDIVASTDDILNPLIQQKNRLSGVPGNQTKVNALDDFIEETKELFPDGFTARKLLEIKRVFDDKFGKSVVDDTGGAVISDAQKKMANTARKILKNNFGDIADALDVESELYTLRPILNRAKAIGETQGSTIRRGSLAAVDLTKPASILDVITSNPRVSSALAKGQQAGQAISEAGQNLPSLSNLPPQLQQLLSTAMATATRPTQTQQNQINQNEAVGNITEEQMSNLTPEQQRELAIIDRAEAAAGGQEATTNRSGLNITPEILNLAQLTLPASEFAKIEDIYNRQQETTEPEKLTEKQRAYQGSIELADEALDLLNTGEVKSGIGRKVTGKIGEKLGTLSEEEQNYRATISLMRTAVKNALLGSAMSEQEIESIAGAIPEFGDDIKTAKRKLKQLKKNLPKLINQNQNNTQTEEQQLLNALQQQGINLSQ